MKKFLCGICMLFLIYSVFAAEKRDLVIPDVGTGEYQVRVSNIEIADLSTDYGNYMTGSENTYITDITKKSVSGFMENVTFPDDKSLYGGGSGKTYPYAGLVIYPSEQSGSYEYKMPAERLKIKDMLQGDIAPEFTYSGKKFPLIVFFHGYPNHPVYEIDFLRNVASHGYVVLALFYGDNRFAKEERVTQLAARCFAAKRSIDTIKDNSVYSSVIDFENIGIAGLSYAGAQSAALTGGKVKVSDGSYKEITSIPEAKVSVIHIPYVSGDIKNHPNEDAMFFGDSFEGLKGIKVPFCGLSGEVDMIAPIAVTKKAMSVFKGDKWLFSLSGIGHSTSKAIDRVRLTTTILLCNYYLKHDEKSFKTFLKLKQVEKAPEMRHLTVVK